MKLFSLELSGFRGIRESVVIQFAPGFTVVTGRNGSGKSTICDAIEYALRGRIRIDEHSEKGEGLQDYLWWRGPGETPDKKVILSLLNDKNELVTIKRTPIEFDISSEMTLEKLLCGSIATQKNCIAHLCRTTIIRDEEITKLSLDLPEIERFEFVRSSLGSIEYSDIESKAEEVIRILRGRLDQVESKYSSGRREITDLTEQLSEARIDASGFEFISDAENSIRELMGIEESDQETDLFKVASEEISRIRLETDKLELSSSQASSIRTQLEGIRSEQHFANVNKYQEEITSIEPDIFEKTNKLSEINSELDENKELNPKLTSLANLLEHGRKYGRDNNKCPLCGSEISKNDFTAHLGEIEQLIDLSSQRLVGLTGERNNILEELNQLERQRDETLENLEELTNRESRLLQNLADIVSDIALDSGENGQDSSKNLIGNLEKMIEHNKKRMRELERSIGVIEASRVLERTIEIEEKINHHREQAKTTELEMAAIREAMTDAKDSFDTIRRISREDVEEQLAELTPLLEEFYIRLKPHVDWQKVRYHLRGDVRRFLSFEVGDGVNPGFIFSSGQRRAAGLAFLFAIHLSRNWCGLDSLVLDDPIQHIDDFRALHLSETLGAIRRTGRQVICTAEDPALADVLCRKLRSSLNDEGKLIELNYEPGMGVRVSSDTEILPYRDNVLVAA